MTRIYILAIILFIKGATASAQTITTIAGNGNTGFLSGDYGGDGGPATGALLYYPSGMAFDGAGNLYIADSRNSRIRKIDPAGTITTFAGTGAVGYSGDGGPATAAELSYPESITFDAANNLYIADHWAACVRKINPAGIITTVAGTGVYGFSGDGGPATDAMLDNPCYVQVDAAGNLYICDWVNARLRKVDASGIITTIAGNGTAPFSGDGGPATAAGMRPSSMLIDAAGNMLICDGVNRRVRKIDAAGTITTIAGSGTDGYSGDGGPATAAAFRYMYGMIMDTVGNLLICDQTNNVIRKIDTAGTITSICGTGVVGYSGDGGPATAAQLRFPTMMVFDPSGYLLVSDLQNNRIRRIDLTEPVTATIHTDHHGENKLAYPIPANDILHISGLTTNTEYTLANIDGRSVRHGTFDKSNASLSLKELPSGIYFLRLTGPGNFIKTIKVVKE
jgi:sugar lactone lactonase YvrE